VCAGAAAHITLLLAEHGRCRIPLFTIRAHVVLARMEGTAWGVSYNCLPAAAVSTLDFRSR
jgi:hypothetical protein